MTDAFGYCLSRIGSPIGFIFPSIASYGGYLSYVREIGTAFGVAGTIIAGLALYVGYLNHKSQKDSKKQIDFLDVKMIT